MADYTEISRLISPIKSLQRFTCRPLLWINNYTEIYNFYNLSCIRKKFFSLNITCNLKLIFD